MGRGAGGRGTRQFQPVGNGIESTGACVPGMTTSRETRTQGVGTMRTRYDSEIAPVVLVTEHGRWRARRQNLSPWELDYIATYGSEHRAAGACFCYLRTKDIPVEDQKVAAIARLAGTTLVLCAHGSPTVLTCYREPRGGFRVFLKLERFGRSKRSRRERWDHGAERPGLVDTCGTCSRRED